MAVSFADLLGGLFKVLSIANEAVKVLNELNAKKEEAKRELQRKGINVDVDLAVIELDNGKVMGAVIVDLPSNVEEGLATILKAFGIPVRVIKGKEV